MMEFEVVLVLIVGLTFSLASILKTWCSSIATITSSFVNLEVTWLEVRSKMVV